MKSKVKTALAVAGCGLAVCVGAAKADTVYNVNLVVGIGSATGTITTDGTRGVLSTADITGWNLLLNDGTTTFLLQGPIANLPLLELRGTIFTATSTGLFFDFSSTQDPGDVTFFDQTGGLAFFCFQDAAGRCDFHPSAISIAIASGPTVNFVHSVETGSVQVATAVPGPIAGAGLPGLILACGGLLGWWRRRRA